MQLENKWRIIEENAKKLPSFLRHGAIISSTCCQLVIIHKKIGSLLRAFVCFQHSAFFAFSSFGFCLPKREEKKKKLFEICVVLWAIADNIKCCWIPGFAFFIARNNRLNWPLATHKVCGVLTQSLKLLYYAHFKWTFVYSTDHLTSSSLEIRLRTAYNPSIRAFWDSKIMKFTVRYLHFNLQALGESFFMVCFHDAFNWAACASFNRVSYYLVLISNIRTYALVHH